MQHPARCGGVDGQVVVAGSAATMRVGRLAGVEPDTEDRLRSNPRADAERSRDVGGRWSPEGPSCGAWVPSFETQSSFHGMAAASLDTRWRSAPIWSRGGCCSTEPDLFDALAGPETLSRMVCSRLGAGPGIVESDALYICSCGDFVACLRRNVPNRYIGRPAA